MCLIRFREIVLKRDLIVYKHLIHNHRINGYVTSYQMSQVNVPSRVTSEIDIEETPNGPVVEKALHSFATIKEAISDAIDEQGNGAEDYVVVKCKIPKGATVYKGTFVTNTAYASDQLEYIEIVKKLPIEDYGHNRIKYR